MWTKTLSNKKVIIGAIIVIIIIFALRSFYSKLKRTKEGKAIGINNSQLNPGINYANEALRVKQVFADPIWAFTGDMENGAAILLTFNNDELKTISNIYRSAYGKTMYSVIKARWCVACPNHTAIIERLEKLNLA